MKLSLSCLAGSLAVCLLSAPMAHAETSTQKIAYIDMQKALRETSAGKRAKTDLEKEFNAKKDELSKREAELKKMDEDLRKKAGSLSDEARNKKVQELQSEAMKFQRDVGESQQMIQKKQAEMTQPILEKIAASLEKVAKAGGYAMVLEKSEQSVLFASKDLDLTDAVVKDYEKSADQKSVKK